MLEVPVKDPDQSGQQEAGLKRDAVLKYCQFSHLMQSHCFEKMQSCTIWKHSELWTDKLHRSR